MADEQQLAPPLPPGGRIVTDAALYNTQITLYRNAMAFGGQKNPSSIWAEMQREDGLAIPYYRELEDKDEDISNALDTLKLSVTKRAQRIVPADDSGLALDVAAFVQQQFDAVPDFHNAIWNLLDAPGYGFSLAELMFDTSMGQASLLDIQDCPQELFLFGNRFQPQIGQLQFLDQVQATTGTEVPEQKFLIFSYRMRSRSRTGRPLLKSVFWPSWFKRNMLRLWLRYAEKGPGTTVVAYPDSADENVKRNAAEIARQIAENVAVAVPVNLTVLEEFLKGTRTINEATYERFYEAMQTSVVRRILGETLTSFGGDKGKGTQALGNVHSETLDDKSVELAKALASIVNRQLVRNLVLWNYGPSAPMPRWEYDTDEAKDLAERISIDKDLQTMGVPMPLSYLQETYSVPRPDGDELIAQAVPSVIAPPIPAVNANFSESAGHELQEQQLAQFDELKAQLDDSVDVLLQQRVREVADALKPKVN